MDEHEMCQNCKRDVPVSNYKMHTLHCARNITKCNVCQEPVNTSDLRIHQEAMHSKKSCPGCGEDMESSKLDLHQKSDCSKRKVICSFCEIDVPAEELTSHEEYCGSRTEKCPECGDFVMLREYTKHQNMRLYHELANKPCAEVFTNTDTNPWTSLTTTVSTSAPSIYGSSEINQKTPSLFSVGGAGQFSSSFNESAPSSSSSSSNRQSFDSRLENSIPDLEFVSTKIPSSSRRESFGKNVPMSPSLSPPTIGEGLQKTVTGIEKNELMEEKEEAVLIPCEFCGEGISIVKLILHQTRCDKNPDSVRLDRPSLSDIIPIDNSNSSEDPTFTIYTPTANGYAVSEKLSPTPINAEIGETNNSVPLTTRKKDSIVEKYLSGRTTEPNVSQTTGGARTKTSYRQFSNEDIELSTGTKRKTSFNIPHTPHLDTGRSSSSFPNLKELETKSNLDNIKIKNTSSVSEIRNTLKNPSIRKSSLQNGSPTDDREELRLLLEPLRKDPFDQELENNDGSFFPCEFCGDPYPVEYLMRHQLSCDLNPYPVTSGDGFNYENIRNRIESNLNTQ